MDTTRSDALLKLLEDKGIPAPTIEHPPVFTVEESRNLRGKIAGLHTKNLFLRDAKKNYFLFVTDEDAVIDLKALGKQIGARGRLSFGSAEALREMLGIEPGSVSLLAVVNDTGHRVELLLDDRLGAASAVNCHPLVNSRTTSLSQEALAKFLAATGRIARYVSLAAEKMSRVEPPHCR
ncbi:MAG: prolyl-tRNA synthetase associated domain-containing protein [Bradyrhizobium sp.]|uniref:prolyl-tRNA synthetase associated domain-containing protein n=1 Tax=Bradyrhizobium sp. TaxID=376 RepID=UPI001DF2794E|nr:prolyl-tRNA synthetase associated domain-containing protein [Bradyrhizobium sp.]MBV9562792.1 prolyl-tRNA synthetase associated domain-containing protein [Bradyrhizobium sp.]